MRTTAEHFRASVTVNNNASSSGHEGRSRFSASVVNALNEPRSTKNRYYQGEESLPISTLMAVLRVKQYQPIYCLFSSSACSGTEEVDKWHRFYELNVTPVSKTTMYGDSVDNTVEENSSVFSPIQMHWLPSATACGQ